MRRSTTALCDMGYHGSMTRRSAVDPATREVSFSNMFTGECAGTMFDPETRTESNCACQCHDVDGAKLIEDAAALMQSEILGLIRDGVIPAAVKTFADLHDYVDANVLGGADDLYQTLGSSLSGDIVAAAQSQVAKWIAAGGHRQQHTADSECDVDPRTECCRGCGVEHGTPCSACGGRGYHVDGCEEIAAAGGGAQ